MREKVLEILKRNLSGAEDNALRAHMQFGKMSDAQLDQQWGQSGRSCRDVYEGYKKDLDEAKACVEWVRAQM